MRHVESLDSAVFIQTTLETSLFPDAAEPTFVVYLRESDHPDTRLTHWLDPDSAKDLRDELNTFLEEVEE